MSQPSPEPAVTVGVLKETTPGDAVPASPTTDGDLRLWARPPKRATLIVGTCLGRST